MLLRALEFPADARPTRAELRARYRQLSLQWHPDKNGNSELSNTRFSEISNAYTMLMQQQQKRDQQRIDDDDDDDDDEGDDEGDDDDGDDDALTQLFQHLWTNVVPVPISESLRFDEMHSLQKLFHTLQKPAMLHVVVDVSLRQAFLGQPQHPVEVERWRRSRTGADTEVEYDRAAVLVDIPRGVVSGDSLLLREQGHRFGCARGDVKIVFQVATTGTGPGTASTSTVFERKDAADLHAVVALSLKESLCGFNRKIELLDGSLLEVASPHSDAVVPPGHRLVLHGRGIACEKRAVVGDLHLHFTVRFPAALPAAQREALASILE